MSISQRLESVATILESVRDQIEDHPEVYSNASWDAVVRTLTKLNLIEDLIKIDEDGQ